MRRNNDELVATYGNLVNRVLTFTYRNFDGCVPEHGNLDARSNDSLLVAEETFQSVDEYLSNCRFKEAIKAAMALAHETNRYLDEKSPWRVIKEDRQAAADSLYVALYVISCLKTALYPFLPFSSQKVHEYLGFNGKVEDYGWQPTVPEPGQKLLEPKPLFTKLDKALADEETSRLGHVNYE